MEQINTVLFTIIPGMSIDVKATEKRNAHKSEIMFKLYSTGKVHEVRYRLYFNSCNLEHVLYNELKDFSDDEKEELSDEFAERYEGNVQGFIDFISDPTRAVPGTYKQTWKFIEKDKNSLQRNSNMKLIFYDGFAVVNQRIRKENKN